MLFEKAAEDYLTYYKVTKSDGTYRFNLTKTKVLIEYFKGVDTSEIDKTTVLNLILYLRDRNQNISNTTINKYIGALKRIIKYSTGHEMEFDKLTEEKKLIQIIPDKTIKKIFNHLLDSEHPESERNLLMFSLLLDTGLRISELLSLNVQDFDFETNTITVKITKTKVHRYVFYTDRTANILSNYIVKYKIRSKLFIRFDNQQELSVESVQKICQRLKKQLNIKHSITPHKWRHTFATRFAERNGNMEVLRIILGHTSLTTTQKYLHVGTDILRNEYLRVNRRPSDRVSYGLER